MPLHHRDRFAAIDPDLTSRSPGLQAEAFSHGLEETENVRR
jgi:hypothetical protein